MRRCNYLPVYVAAVALACSAGAVSAQTIFMNTLGGPNGARDTWNNSSNWTAGIPSGAVNAAIAPNLTAEAWNTSTPMYSGTLTLNNNSVLQMGWTTNFPQSANAMGGAGVTMHDGSRMLLRLPFTVNMPALTLSGDASLDLSPSTSAHHQTRNISNPISGAGALTVTGNNNNTLHLNVANPGWSGGFIADAVDGWRVEANVSGAFGTGDVTINARAANDRGATLQIDAANAIADSAALSLNGPRDQRKASKLIMNANDTVGAFLVDGTLHAAGAYTSGSGLLDSAGNPLITGGSTLTVAGIPLYWDTNGATTGTNPSSTGNLTDASWTLDAAGETALLNWATGYDVVFSAGTDGTGVQQITVTGPQSVKSLTVEEGTALFVNGGAGSFDINGGSGTASVAAGATLGGNVAIGGNLTGAGDIAPGLSAGAITVGGSFDMSGIYRWELGAPLDDTTGTAGVAWDLINTGSADLSSLTLDLAFVDSATDPDSGDPFWTSDHTWLIVDSGAPITGDFLGITFDDAATAFEAGSFDTSIDGNQAFLQFNAGGTGGPGGPGGGSGAVPEPASIAVWSLIALGLAGYGVYRAQRKKASTLSTY